MTITLTLMVGISGSGKSTHAAKLARATDAVIVEPDAIRKELTGDATDQSRNGEVFRIAHSRATSILLDGKSVIIDATNLDRKTRAEWIAIGQQVGVTINAVQVCTPTDVAKNRNNGRERVVPLAVIDKQARRLSPPSHSEGFDHIVTV